MKQILLSSMVTLVTVTLVACGSGGGSSAATYLPAGNYNVVLNNPSPAGCGTVESGVMTSNGQGQLCDSTGDCQTINVANNPCWSQTATQSGVTVSGSWNNCQLSSSNILTAIAQVSFSGSGQLSCTYNVTATPQ